MRDKSKLFPQFLFRSLRESHLPFSKNDYDSNRPHTSLDEAHPDGGRKPPDEAMTILELFSLHLSVDGLVKAIACDQRNHRQTPERHRAPQGQSGNERPPLLGSNGSYWHETDIPWWPDDVCS
jgi:hypothetical protein